MQLSKNILKAIVIKRRLRDYSFDGKRVSFTVCYSWRKLPWILLTILVSPLYIIHGGFTGWLDDYRSATSFDDSVEREVYGEFKDNKMTIWRKIDLWQLTYHYA